MRVPFLALSLMLSIAWASTAAQSAAVRDTIVNDSVASDTIVRDTTAKGPSQDTIQDTISDTTQTDTTKLKELVKWRGGDDSTLQALLTREGFRVTRYQGDTVTFNATTRQLQIIGEPGAVGRDLSLIVGDTVIYNDSTKVIVALGDTVVLRDPEQQAADVVAFGRVSYNTTDRRAIVSNVKTSVESNVPYYVTGDRAAFVGDTTGGKHNRFYVKDGIVTSCDHEIPDYYFRCNEIKFVSPNFIVARPAVLYIADVPVFWIPFLFQDLRKDRASGFLTPRFSISDIVRNSPGSRRAIDNVGYYVNMGKYLDGAVWFDWRSGARATEYDPGFVRWHGQLNYVWRDRFMRGYVAFDRLIQRDGSRAFTLSATHSQDFSRDSRLVANINYTTNSIAQRQSLVDPRAVLSTIRSDFRYSRKIGDFSLDVGGNRVQYPGRTQIEENFPTISFSGPTIALNSWLEWTPAVNYTRAASKNTDGVGTFSYRYFTNADGLPDSSRVRGSTSNQTLNFSTPFSIKGFQISLGVNASQQSNDFPITRTFIDPADTSQRITRTYARSYLDGVDWNFGFALPSFFSNTFRVRPDLSFQNVMGGSFWVRSELSRGRFVSQSKRLNAGVSVSPTFFGLFPGFGPITRIRHSITPTLRYGFAPRGRVSAAYLEALNQSPYGFLGALPQNRLSLTLSQVFEAKLRGSEEGGEERKIKLLGIQMSSFDYDFELARKTKRTGLTTDRFSYDLSSDLLPGVTFRSEYSLFEGSVYSDSARFKPFRESISAGMTLTGESAVIVALGRLFGRKAPPARTSSDPKMIDTLPDNATSMPATGMYSRNSRLIELPPAETWNATLNFSSQRQRPPRGGRVLTYDPATYCQQFIANPLVYDQCVQDAILNPSTSLPYDDPIGGGAFVRMPPRETLQGSTTFHITPSWQASWSTMYDFVTKRFASHQVTLQRELHDWRAVFNISSSPNGAFYFSFYIINKAQPELRLPYTKPSYRQPDLQ